MTEIEKMLAYNKQFVESELYEQYKTSKFPDKKIPIVTCMDTRLVQLLPAALGIKNGDVKIIKNAGGTITNPFDSTVCSLLVAIYELGVNSIWIHRAKEEFESEEGKQILRDLGIEGDYIGIGHVALGYAAKPLPAPKARKADYIHWVK